MILYWLHMSNIYQTNRKKEKGCSRNTVSDNRYLDLFTFLFIFLSFLSQIPSNMIGFNSRNETIKLPPADVIPPILLSTETNFRGVQMYIITAYFKHPSLICSPYAYNVHPGKGLFIQMGYNVEKQYERIPLESRRLSSQWKQGSCIPKMGLHYFKNLTPRQPCEKLYPVFLMYNSQGQLGAFGWLFQGTPPTYKYNNDELKWFKLSPPYYPFTFQTKQLPACMFNPEFRVFGLHIWLRNADNMLCPVPTRPPKLTRPQPPTRPVIRTTQSPDNNNIIVIEDNSSSNKRLSTDVVLLLMTVCVVLSMQSDLNVLHLTTTDSVSGLS
ncbi:uncharacterized protein LOC121380738 [Gigantopelta aegis]|uniref:uncharacterized protein LOC121380738 n=1 Tax=Gigantopelta aegis TaxID=1735272 RepID=UPI001B88D497|nr:uncharacterized protein LOC121380738 [Gigantopelta aegis]